MKQSSRWMIGCTTLMVVVLATMWGAWRLSKSRTHQVFGTLVSRVATTDSVVALTFDDGPTVPYTDSVLSTLAAYDVPATFFVVGEAIERYPEVAARIVAAGHELGNHSYSHRQMVLKTPGFMRHEVEETDRLIRSVGQPGPALFRPPYFKRLLVLPWYLAREGRPTVLADVEPDTYFQDAERMIDHVLGRVRPGSIILLHVEIRSRGEGRAALPGIIEGLKERGYRFVTLSALLRDGPS